MILVSRYQSYGTSSKSRVKGLYRRLFRTGGGGDPGLSGTSGPEEPPTRTKGAKVWLRLPWVSPRVQVEVLRDSQGMDGTMDCMDGTMDCLHTYMSLPGLRYEFFEDELPGKRGHYGW